MTVRTPIRFEEVKKRHQRRLTIRLLGPEDEAMLTEDEADEIMEWTMTNQVGVRTSFDMWEFDNREDLTVFLLKWT